MNFEDSPVALLPVTRHSEAAAAVKQVAAMSWAVQAITRLAVLEQTARARRVQRARALLVRARLGRVPALADRHLNRLAIKTVIHPTGRIQETLLPLAGQLRVDQAAEGQVERRQVAVNSLSIR